MSYFRNQLESWLRTIDVKADRVLDVGGKALPVYKRVKSWDMKEYQIWDSELEEGVMIAKKFDLNTDSVNLKNTESWDVIFCLEVFEYVYDPVKALKSLYNLLKPGGILYISFPTIYPVHQPVKFDFLRYTGIGVAKLLSVAGFSETKVYQRRATNGLQHLSLFFGAEGMHPVKNDPIIFDIGYMVEAYK